MAKAEPLFGLSLVNVPIINLRNEFASNLRLLSDETFRANLENTRDLVYTEYFAYVTREAFLTHTLQRSIVGIESYLPWAVLHEAGLRKCLTAETFPKVRDPFSLGGRSTVANYYDRLPSLVAAACSLRTSDPKLYERTSRFYREIRNPLFHGNEVQNDPRGDHTLEAMQFIARLYGWIDSWCPLSDMWRQTRTPEQQSTAADPNNKAGKVTLKLRIPTLRKP